jgi:hypothetical protein
MGIAGRNSASPRTINCIRFMPPLRRERKKHRRRHRTDVRRVSSNRFERAGGPWPAADLEHSKCGSGLPRFRRSRPPPLRRRFVVDFHTTAATGDQHLGAHAFNSSWRGRQGD